MLKNWFLYSLKEFFRKNGENKEDVIIFVRMNARTRFYNFGSVLQRKQNIRTILVTQVFEYDFQRQAFDEIKIFLSYSHLKRIVSRYGEKYNIIVLIASLQPAAQALVLLNMDRYWPVFIDHYDSLWCLSYFSKKATEKSDTFTNISQEEINAERFCFENADGIIARSGTLLRLIEENHIKTPIYLIEDKCNKKFFQPVIPHNGPKRSEWSVVYAGIFYPMNFDKNLAGDTQFVPLGRFFAEERIHFNLYPSPHHNYQYPEYYEEASRNPYFHIHSAVDFDKVHQEINQYDFGWNSIDFSRSILFSETSRKYELSLKFYTYLEAGLPVIINGLLERSKRIISETGCGFIFENETPQGLRKAIESQDMIQMKKNVIRARESLEIDTISDELFEFLQNPR